VAELLPDNAIGFLGGQVEDAAQVHSLLRSVGLAEFRAFGIIRGRLELERRPKNAKDKEGK
jgi:hypothetical protein